MSGPPNDFLLHRAAWENDFRLLDSLLQEGKEEVDGKDPRGRTPLHLAVSLGHIESARVLLRHKADVAKENAQGWTVLHEAVSTGDPEMVHVVLQHRDFQQAINTLGGVPELLRKINQTPDFYVEMKWEFTSWVPLVSRVCPGDVCRIWKSGARLRVDITLLGFENMSWERGRRSLVFRGEESGRWAELMEVNHEEKVVWTERFELTGQAGRLTLDAMTPRPQDVERRLTAPLLHTALDTRRIAFERTTSGFWVWKTERSERVSGYHAHVFTANNLDVVTRIRTEHLTQEEKARYKAERSPFESFLGSAEHEFGAQQDGTTESASTHNPTAITPEEYFDPGFDLKDRDIGRPKEVTVRTQKLKATLWMSEGFPLSLVEQVGPIVELMARSSPHFARLRDFIALDFPPGFPLKIEIPLFHVLNARITFGNVNGCRGEGPPAQNLPEGGPAPPAPPPEAPPPFAVDPSVFEAPPTYRLQEEGHHVNPDHGRDTRDEEHDLMQFALRRSLDQGQRPGEPLGPDSNGAVPYSQDFSLQYQRALEESLHPASGPIPRDPSSFEQDLQLAMELSVREEQEAEQRRRQEEDAALQEALRLSLIEK